MCQETAPDAAPKPPTPDLISMAQRTRRHAAAYRETVERYCAEMPEYLDRFHEAMQAFRATAAHLRGHRTTGPDQPTDPQSGDQSG